MYLDHQKSTFLIYDYETFGLDPALDRVAQFASIKVNGQFFPIEKPKIFFCQIPNDYLPNPESVLITGITPQYTLCNGLTESEFAYRVFKIFTTPNTCIVGYNNIHFDDEFSRNIFYRNFCDPYSWSYKDGNSRWDILQVLRAYLSLCPIGIKWPINTKNKISLRLTDLTYANSILHMQAHTADSDIYATLEIMKLIQKAQPQLFHFLYTHRTKNQLKKIINFNMKNPLIYISNNINEKHKNFINFIVPIAWHPINQNILVAFNLSNDVNSLLNLNINTIYQNLYHNHDQQKIYNIFKIIPLQLIRLNACPVLIPIDFFLKNNNIFNCTKQLISKYYYCFKNLSILRTKIDSVSLSNKISALYTFIESYIHQKKMYNQIHVDNQLYRQFFTIHDQRMIKKIRNTDPKNLSTININNLDIRLKPLLFFYRARNFPNYLNQQEQKQWASYKKKFACDQDRYSKYLDKLYILESAQEYAQKTKLLNALRKYYQDYYRSVSIL